MYNLSLDLDETAEFFYSLVIVTCCKTHYNWFIMVFYIFLILVYLGFHGRREHSGSEVWTGYLDISTDKWSADKWFADKI